MQSIRKNNFGFTLIEMLIVAAIIAVISLAIYSAFNNGIKIWQRIGGSLPEENVVIFLNKFNRDLKNTFQFKEIKFMGDETTLEFASLITSQSLQNRTVGKVTYLYNASNGTLNRIEKDFSQIYYDKEGRATEPLAGIEELKFRYYHYSDEKKEYLWSDIWQKSELPFAVRLELNINNDNQTETYIKTISLPTKTRL